MKYIKLYDNRHDFVFDEQRYFPNTALVNGEDEPTYFTDVEEVVFELTVTLPTEKVVTGQTYTLAVEYGGADVFSEATVTTTGDVTLNGTQFTANTDGDFSVTATYDDKTVTLNGTSKLMTAAPTIFESSTNNQYGQHYIHISKSGATKRATFNGVEYTSDEDNFSRLYYEELTAQTVVVTATAQETGKWESDTATATFNIPAAQTLTATISDDTLEDGQTAQLTVMYGSTNATSQAQITASGDVTCTSAGVVTAAYSTGSGSIVVSLNNLPAITINVTVAEPAQNIVFADNDVKTIITNLYGTDGEITEEQAAAVTTFVSGNATTNPFYNNTYVDSFDEFAYFTGVTQIGNNTFYGCSNMTSITIPENVTYINNLAFDYCSSLGSITIPDSVTYIGRSAFQACSGLTTLNLGSYVETIDIYAFKQCSSLTSVNIPDSVTTLGDQAFNSCTNLNTVTIGQSVSAITSDTFPRTISYVSVSSQNNTYDSRDNCNGIIETSTNKLILGCKNTVIPSTVTYIGDSAFNGCTGLTSVTIPANVTSIGSSALRGCTGLTSVTIPANVTSIGSSAVNGCTSLTAITCEATTPPTLGTLVFNNTNNCPIYVPAASVDTYKAANKWSNYADRIQAIGGGGDEPEYAVAVIDCSELEDANPFDHYDNEAQSNAEYLGLDFGPDTYVENGVITIPPEDDFSGIAVAVPDPAYDGCIGYIKLTHPSAEYKLNEETTSSVGEDAGYTCDVDFDSTTLTTTFSNFVSEDQESPFTGTLALTNCGSTDIKITRIEVAFIPAEEEPAE